MRREKRAVKNFDPNKKTVGTKAALYSFLPPHPLSAHLGDIKMLPLPNASPSRKVDHASCH